jgi:hypothetical protein
MGERDVVPLHGDRECAVVTFNLDLGSERQCLRRWQFDRRPGKRKGAQRADLVRWRGARLDERSLGQPPDIAVALQLAPRPAFVGAIIDHHTLALQRLRVERGVVRRLAAHRHHGIEHFEFLALDKALGLDFALEVFGGKIAARRSEPWVSHSGPSTVYRARGRPGIRHPRAVPVLRSASRRRYRDAASFWRVRQNVAGTGRR